VKRNVGYRWKLREVMAGQGLWKTSDLSPLLAERGVELSAAQTYRLVARIPQRLSLHTLAALCDIFSCTPDDLIECFVGPAPKKRASPPGAVVDLALVGRPRRARVQPNR
jgi:DNA-binding Xre family transcriptional regulator